MSDTTCQHVREDGTRCRSKIGLSADTRLCMHHDPDRSEQVTEARRAGLQAQRESQAAARRRAATRAVEPGEEPPPLQTPADAVAWSSWLATAAATGAVSPQVAREVGAAIREFRSSFDTAQMAAQLAENARLIKKLQADRKR
jgi:hypothetical protein